MQDAREWQEAHQGTKENCKASSKPRTQGLYFTDATWNAASLDFGVDGELQTRAITLCVRVPPRTGSSPQHSLLKV